MVVAVAVAVATAATTITTTTTNDRCIYTYIESKWKWKVHCALVWIDSFLSGTSYIVHTPNIHDARCTMHIAHITWTTGQKCWATQRTRVRMRMKMRMHPPKRKSHLHEFLFMVYTGVFGHAFICINNNNNNKKKRNEYTNTHQMDDQKPYHHT